MQHPSVASQIGHQAGEGVLHTTYRTLMLNGLLSGFKLILGLIGQSQVLVADGIHSLSDCMTDIGILLGARYWSAPADERHPYGHWRLESLVTIAMAISLVFVAGGLIVRAWHSIQASTATEPAWYTLVVAILTLISKEAMFQWTKKKSEALRSQALLANAWHQRSDALSSLPTVVAIAAAMVFPRMSFIDPLGAVIVSLFILAAAKNIFIGAIRELMDESLPPAKQAEMEAAVCAVPGVTSAHALRSRKNGPGYFLDLHVQVPGDLTVRESHNIARNVRQKLLHGTADILDAVIHIEPDDE